MQRHGVRRPVSAADPPHRPDASQGEEQCVDRGPGRSRQSLGDRLRRGRAQVRAPGARTLEGFRHLVGRARRSGIDIALDIAFQCSPDHPYVKEHPQWFKRRPDGGIQYAENPPKKYEDIYPFDFEREDWQALWEELKSVFKFWVEQGVHIFRVDNPHTKPFRFWEWAIAEVKREFPDAIFLSEAFTRPRLMEQLAKAGFTQSYTYFAWKTTKEQIADYFTLLNTPPLKDYFRPNAWPNTPDILTEYLSAWRAARRSPSALCSPRL